jgi:hypothetical protein
MQTSELTLTNRTKSAAHVDEGEVLDPNTAVLMTTNHPSERGGWAVADVRHS